MLYLDMRNTADYSFLPESVQKAIQFAKSLDLKNMEKGMHELEGQDLFVNIIEYETKDSEDRFWEGHKDYLDMHVPIEGEECIEVSFIDNMNVTGYEKENDFVQAQGPAQIKVFPKNQEALILYPQDIHKTAVKTNGNSEKVKKAVFKIKI